MEITDWKIQEERIETATRIALNVARELMLEGIGKDVQHNLSLAVYMLDATKASIRQRTMMREEWLDESDG